MGCGTSFWLKTGQFGSFSGHFWAKSGQKRSKIAGLAGFEPVSRQTPARGGGLSRGGAGTPGQADELAQIEGGGSHPQLKVSFNQAG